VRCVNKNRKKRKRLHWQAANHGCHCFDRAFLWLALAFVAVFVYATHATQAIAFEWKPGLKDAYIGSGSAAHCLPGSLQMVVIRWMWNAENRSCEVLSHSRICLNVILLVVENHYY